MLIDNKCRRILIAGGACFLGFHQINRLVARGDEVICVDNLLIGSKRNIEHLLAHLRFEFIRHNLTCSLLVETDQAYI